MPPGASDRFLSAPVGKEPERKAARRRIIDLPNTENRPVTFVSFTRESLREIQFQNWTLSPSHKRLAARDT